MSRSLAAPVRLFFGKVETRAAAILVMIGIVTAVVWVTSVATWPQGLSLLIVSYTLGLREGPKGLIHVMCVMMPVATARHALDADHIAAIDNTTRKLLQAGQQPTTVGLMFSLGHSSVVLIAAMLVAICSASINARYENYHDVSGYIGASISSAFLTFVGVIKFNAVGVYAIIKKLREVKAKGGAMEQQEWEEILNSGGPITRLLGKRLFQVIDAPYKMYFVGFLFGLGFDTATEITILAIASLQGAKGTSPGDILFLPLLFTCGMALLDYLDGLLMAARSLRQSPYCLPQPLDVTDGPMPCRLLVLLGWALVSPLQKLYYNLVITTVSALFAFFIAAVQFLGIVQEATGAEGSFWDGLSAIGDETHFMGLGLVAASLVGWAFAAVVYYGGQFHAIDAAIKKQQSKSGGPAPVGQVVEVRPVEGADVA